MLARAAATRAAAAPAPAAAATSADDGLAAAPLTPTAPAAASDRVLPMRGVDTDSPDPAPAPVAAGLCAPAAAPAMRPNNAAAFARASSTCTVSLCSRHRCCIVREPGHNRGWWVIQFATMQWRKLNLKAKLKAVPSQFSFKR